MFDNYVLEGIKFCEKLLKEKYLKIIFSIYQNLRFKMDLPFNWQTLLLWLKGLSLHGIDFLKTHS